jgi:hypothetical protein
LQQVYQNYFDILQTIDESISKNRLVPALILLYSAIDSFSSLSNNNGSSGRQVFKSWVKTWMLKDYKFDLNEDDLYSARCGLIHQHISESDLTKSNKAREIHYVWGNAKLPILGDAIQHSGNNAVAVRVEDLISAFRIGMANCMKEIYLDPEWRKMFDERAERLFINILHRV